MNKFALVTLIVVGALGPGAVVAATPSRPPAAPAARPAPAPAPTTARAPTPSFGTTVKPQVGSGSSAKGGTSGLRPRFNNASGAAPASSRAGGSAVAAAGSAGKSGSARPLVRPAFNKASGSGAGRIDGNKTPAPRPRPSATDAFGKTAMKAEHAEGKKGAARRGQAIHENAVKARPPNKPAP